MSCALYFQACDCLRLHYKTSFLHMSTFSSCGKLAFSLTSSVGLFRFMRAFVVYLPNTHLIYDYIINLLVYIVNKNMSFLDYFIIFLVYILCIKKDYQKLIVFKSLYRQRIEKHYNIQHLKPYLCLLIRPV